MTIGTRIPPFPYRPLAIEQWPAVRQPLAAVIVREDHDRVVREPETFERLQDFPDALIDGFHHRSVVGTSGGAVLLRQLLGTGSRRGRRFAGCLIRPVRCVVGDVHEERTLRRGALLDEPDRPIRDEIRHVLAVELWIDARVVLPEIGSRRPAVMVVEVDVAAQEPEKILEPMGARPGSHRCSEMPLPDETRGISVVLQQLRERCARDLQRRYRPSDNAVDEVTLLISPIDQTRPRRTAQHAVRVKVGEFNSIASKAVDVGRLDVGSTIAAQIAISHVIAHDQHDVGTSGLCRLRTQRCHAHDGQDT